MKTTHVKCPFKDHEKKSIEEYLQAAGLHLNDCEDQSSRDTASFSSSVKSIKLKCDGGVQFMIILKDIPSDYSEDFHPHSYFFWETHMYQSVFPELSLYSQQMKVADPFKYVKCLTACTEYKKEFIILEDAKERNYHSRSRDLGMDLSHLKVAIDQLSKYHATVFAYKLSHPDKFACLTKDMEERYLQIQPWFERVFECSYCKLTENIANEKTRRIINNVYPSIYNQITNLVASGEDEYCVIGHGDFWTGNILFKYHDNEPVDCLVIDWQLVRCNSPVIDLLHLIVTSTAASVRTYDHFQALLRHYYAAFSSNIQMFNLVPESIFPNHVYESHLRKFGVLGLVIGVLSLPLHARNADDIFTLDDMAHNKKDILDFSPETYKNYYSLANFMCDSLVEAKLLPESAYN